MNLNENIIEFGDYIEKSNYCDDNLSCNKYFHSLRVSEFAAIIAKSLNLNKKDVYIASLAGLLHDIGRISEYKKYHTYLSSSTFDHGEESYRVLKKEDYICAYTLDEEIQKIVLLSVRYHNKYEIPKNLSKREKMFCNIVRDADKIDILSKLRCSKKGLINQKLIDSYKEHKMCKNEDITNSIDGIVRNLSFVFDFVYNESLQIIKTNKIIDSLLENIKEFSLDDSYKEIENIINEYLKEVDLC